MKYQLIILGPKQNSFKELLVETLKEQLCDLGLDPQQDFEALNINKKECIDWRGIPVMVWFGGLMRPCQDEIDLLELFIKESFSVFPVVDDLKNYSKSVPPVLSSINGQVWNQDRLAANILQAFRLIRKMRQAFISYRRVETRAVAIQLFAEFSKRGYRMFLDTASVESGEDFQEALWGRMIDVDLLVFLDSPNALSSRWVYEELNRAQGLGLGCLQLVWPNHTPTSGTDFCDHYTLSKANFVDGQINAESCLNEETLASVLSAAEQTRIRSLSSRRRRIVQDLVDQARINNFEAIVHPVGVIELRRNNLCIAEVYPVVGVPNAEVVQQYETQHDRQKLSTTRIIYTGLGIHPEYAKHLEWLNRSHSLMTNQVDLLEDWLDTL